MSLGTVTMTNEQGNSRSGVDDALRWIGDLDHPFYNDERQRFVWYEASAIGFQLLLMLQFVAGGLTLLIFGSPSWPYVMLALAPTLITTLVIIGYAGKHGAPYFATSSDLKRSRGILGAAIGLLWAAGALRAGLGSGGDVTWDLSTIAGIITGAVAVGLVVAAGFFVANRMQERTASEDDSLD